MCRTKTNRNRWAYLEKNVNNVMTKLQEGLDMKTYMCVKLSLFRPVAY
jgi:hypothetical protein